MNALIKRKSLDLLQYASKDVRIVIFAHKHYMVLTSSNDIRIGFVNAHTEAAII